MKKYIIRWALNQINKIWHERPLATYYFWEQYGVEDILNDGKVGGFLSIVIKDDYPKSLR